MQSRSELLLDCQQAFLLRPHALGSEVRPQASDLDRFAIGLFCGLGQALASDLDPARGDAVGTGSLSFRDALGAKMWALLHLSA